jgi:hypothetical protein
MLKCKQGELKQMTSRADRILELHQSDTKAEEVTGVKDLDGAETILKQRNIIWDDIQINTENDIMKEAIYIGKDGVHLAIFIPETNTLKIYSY